jgi:type IV pilus modification protein PilV
MSATKSTGGFTLIEVLVAITILSVGILALAGTAGTVNRLIAQGKRRTQSAQVAAQRFEILRRVANQTATRCTSASFANGTQSYASGYLKGVTETWTISTSGTMRTITEIVSRPTTRGTRADTLQTKVSCI